MSDPDGPSRLSVHAHFRERERLEERKKENRESIASGRGKTVDCGVDGPRGRASECRIRKSPRLVLENFLLAALLSRHVHPPGPLSRPLAKSAFCNKSCNLEVQIQCIEWASERPRQVFGDSSTEFWRHRGNFAHKFAAGNH